MKVPFLDMKKEAEILVNNALMDDIKDVVLSGHYLFGPKSQELEDRLSEFFNSNVILVGSGTDALYLLLRAFGIGQGDKVAIPAVSAIPTAVAIKMTGAECVYLDVCPHSMSINGQLLVADVSAVIPVHLYGNTVKDLNGIINYCNGKEIPVIEDCAQSFGAKIDGKYVGTIGSAGAFSFYPTKNIGCFGDGGAVLTNDTSLASEIKELRFYGQKDKYAMGPTCGMNSRMDEIQSTILLKKFECLKTTNKRRLHMLERYNCNFAKIESDAFYTLSWNDGCMPQLYPIFVKNRKRFINHMDRMGIGTAIHYPFTLPAAIDKCHREYIAADTRTKKVVSLPFNPWMSDKEIEYVINTVMWYAK